MIKTKIEDDKLQLVVTTSGGKSLSLSQPNPSSTVPYVRTGPQRVNICHLNTGRVHSQTLLDTAVIKDLCPTGIPMEVATFHKVEFTCPISLLPLLTLHPSR